MLAFGRDLSALARAWSSLTRFAAPVILSLRAMGSVMREVSRTTSASARRPNATTSKKVEAKRSPESMTCTGMRGRAEKEDFANVKRLRRAVGFI